MVAPFALATVTDGTAERPALVVDLDGDPTWRDLSDLGPTVHALLQDWDSVLRTLHTLTDQATRPLEREQVRRPFVPGQVLQAGANYRTHVVELAVKHAPSDRPESEVRAEATAALERRTADSEPYLFIGLPSAITGPYDDVVLPAYSQWHDWELELAAVIGREAFRVDRARALEHVACYTIANDLTTRDLVFRRDMPAIGTDWFRAKNAPGFTPLGPTWCPRSSCPSTRGSGSSSTER